jgi:polyketide synthase 12/epothilone polyketide synthase D
MLLGHLGQLYTLGHPVDFSKLYTSHARKVALPSYPWQRERFWIDQSAAPEGLRSRTAAGSQGRHPLVATHLEVVGERHYFTGEIHLGRLPFLADHRVDGAVVIPGAAYVEMALAAAAQAFESASHVLEDVAFEELWTVGEQPSALQVVLEPRGGGRVSFEVFSRTADPGAPWRRHARGVLRKATGEAEVSGSLAEIRARCTTAIPVETHYQSLAEIGLEYGPHFRGVRELWRGEGEILARVELPAEASASAAEYVIHPALLDACLQSAASLATPGDGMRMLPVGLRSFQPGPSGGRELWCHVVRRPAGSEGGARGIEADLFLFAGEGSPRGALRGLQIQYLPGRKRDMVGEALYAVEWREQERPKAEPGPARVAGGWLLFVDRGVAGEALASRLEARGDTCVRVWAADQSRPLGERRYELEPGDVQGLERVLKEAQGQGVPLRGVIHLWSLDAAGLEATFLEALPRAQRLGAESVLLLVQAIARAGLRDAPRLWLVTGGAQPVSDEPSLSVLQAPLWGLARTIVHEQPELRCVSVDLSVRPGAEELEALATEIREETGREDQVGLRGARRYVARLVRSTEDRPVRRSVRAGNVPFRLEISKPGVLDDLTLRAMTRQAPRAGEVEIEVAAAGLNFLDVLLALGAIEESEVGPSGPALGFELAGRIARVGPGVTGLVEGQEVIAVAPRGLGSFVLTSSQLVVPKPVGMSFEEAAAIPVAFLTAHYALEHVGRLRAGERVLIHAAAGGVGLAAVQIAQRLGAEIFATAGTEEKREYLRSLGVRHVLDSRSLAFANEVLARTGGEGVDVVLNSLGGEFIPKSLEVLRDYGRFLEIGKRDYFRNQQLGLRPFLKKLTFSLVDLRGMMRERPALVQQLFREVTALFESGALRLPRNNVYPVARAVDAFRAMAQGEHIGKNVLSFAASGPQPVIAAEARAEPRISPEATYLLTGGLGGVGLALARYLVAQGARSLVLMGRSAPGVAAQEALEGLRAAGARVEVAQVDVADTARVAALLEDMGRRLPPLRGIVHAAAVLDDATLPRQTPEHFRRVAGPKVLGAWNLHSLTQGLPLDFFVLCSSVASVLGSPGQANYCAANAFIDALAHLRQANGQPALCINYGPWAEVGLAAAQANRGERMALQGMESFTPAQGVEVFARLLRRAAVQVSAIRLYVRQWRESYLSAARSPFLSELEEQGAPGAGASKGSLREKLLARPVAEREALLQSQIQELLGHVLRCPPSRIGLEAPFKALGVDSLMAIEFRNRLEAALGVSLSAALIWQYSNILALAVYLAGRMEVPLREEPAVTATPPPPPEPKPEVQVSEQGAQKILLALRKLVKKPVDPSPTEGESQ